MRKLPAEHMHLSTRSGICAKPSFWLVLSSLCMVVLLGGCATVSDTYGSVSSSVSTKFGKKDDPELASELVPAGEQDAKTEKPVVREKPLLVDIQEKLRVLGYYSGPISGRLDSRTEAAIQDFQLDNDLRINGRPTQALLDAIDQAASLI